MPARFPVSSPPTAYSDFTAAYIFGSDNALLVDPAGRSDEITTALRERNAAHVAVTHHHPDHVGAVSYYASEFDLTVWCRTGRQSQFESATGCTPDRTFSHGTVLPVAGGVEVYDTPGHAPEHVGFIASHGDQTVLVSGDLVVAEGTVVVGSPEGDVRAYLSSLRRVLARDFDRLLPSHGPVIADTRATCRRLIEHRLRREKLVLAAVRDGIDRPPAIVEKIYEKDVMDVYDLALATVVAHLEKLDVEGTVEWDGDLARPGDVLT